MILYIQYECNDNVRDEVEEIIDFYAGGIANSTVRKADKCPLFKNTWLIHVMFNYALEETCIRDITDKLQRALYGGNGRYILFKLPNTFEERNKMLDARLSTEAIAWLNDHYDNAPSINHISLEITAKRPCREEDLMEDDLK